VLRIATFTEELGGAWGDQGENSAKGATERSLGREPQVSQHVPRAL
jgi:hypothetical protein